MVLGHGRPHRPFSVIWMVEVKQQPSFVTDLLAHLTHGLLSSLSSPSASPSAGLGTRTSQTSRSSFSYWSLELDAGRDRYEFQCFFEVQVCVQLLSHVQFF